MRCFFLFLLVWMSLALLPAPAWACSCIVGLDEGFLVPEPLELPANAKGLVWWTGGRYVPSGDRKTLGVRFEVHRVQERLTEPVPFELRWLDEGVILVVPEKLVTGATYRFSGQRGDETFIRVGSAWRSVEVSVLKERVVTPPNQLRLEIGPPELSDLRVSAGGSCSQEAYAVQRRVRLMLPPGLERFASVLMFSTFLDGKPWRPSHSMCIKVRFGESWVGRGEDLLYAACPRKAKAGGPGSQKLVILGDPGGEPGRHRVRMRAELPGTDLDFEAQASFELGCVP